MTENIQLKALSINQPWGWAILHAGKDIENRDWHTKFRGEFLIHVGLKYDLTDDDVILDIGKVQPPGGELRTGGIIGQATLVDCVDKSDSPWFFGRYGFVLENVKALPFRPCKGQLGFFTPDYSSVYAKDKPKIDKPKIVSPQRVLI